MALRYSEGLLSGLRNFGQQPARQVNQTLAQPVDTSQALAASLGGLFGVDMRSPAAIEAEAKAAEELKAKQAEAATQGLLMSQLEASTALTASQKETYKAMINSGDINPQQILDAIATAEKAKQEKTQTSQIKTALLDQGFTEEELNRLTPAQLQTYVKSTIDQKRSQVQTVEGANAYLSTLEVAPEYAEQAKETIANDSWVNLTEAQRTKYFDGLVQQTKTDKAVSNLTRMVASLPEGERKQEAETVLEDVKAGFVAPDKARDLIRVKKDPSMTETNTVVYTEAGKPAKVINKKVGNDTVKVYLDPISGEEKPVTANMLETKRDIPKSGWPSSSSMKFVEELALSSDVVSEYMVGYDPWGFGDYRLTPEEALDKKLELGTMVEKLKKEGLTPPEVKQQILNKINTDSDDSSAILKSADDILKGN